MTSPRARRVRRAALAVGQASLGVLLVAGVAWAGGQPAVTERIDAVDVARTSADGRQPGSTTVALERATLVCPGPELLGLDGARDLALETSATVVAAPVEAVGDVPVPSGTAALGIEPLPTATAPDDDADDSDRPDPTTVATSGLSETGAYLASGTGAAAPGLVATQETFAETEEVAGLASVPCGQAGPTAWLLGGGGGPGRAERLIVTNPGSNPVTVDITAYGVEGTTSPPDGQGLVVPAQGRVVLLSDALAPQEAQPAFGFVADGGDIAVALFETSLTGTQPTGFDAVTNAADPSRDHVIAGVQVPSEDSGTLLVRVVNPSDTEAIGTVAALTAQGERQLPEAVVRVPAGSVVDVPVSGLPAGPTTLAVSADTEVLAAARTFVSDGGPEAAWAVSRPALDGVGGAALPTRDDVTRTLVVAARGAGATVAVTQVAGGEATTSEALVPANGTVTVPLTGDGVWVRQVAGSGEVHGAVVTTGADGGPVVLSSVPLVEPLVSARRSEVVPLG
ncbi:hypothetical protein GA707_17005 [Nostocoides sp. F2B08]|uniref:DUF5719 family protein n=1 Tax=Nostocoides sp. F2B08 TaxID=2653936 RepID=UPI0012630DF4|nr:DUF5719 family protein [Tetrasphaera sp. F2B08]KAB7741909.1 hypothetical protein GA707_17005 [Tetrasphaera sp. F2B08]